MKFTFLNEAGQRVEHNVQYEGTEVVALNNELRGCAQPISFKDAQKIHDKYWQLSHKEEESNRYGSWNLPKGFPVDTYGPAFSAMYDVIKALETPFVIEVDPYKNRHTHTFRDHTDYGDKQTYTVEEAPSSNSFRQW